MRDYDKSAVGIHHNNSNSKQLGAGDRRPSKLELMRDDYQRKLLREKEEKMVQLYEDSKLSQRQAMMRVMARNGSGGGGGASGGPGDGNAANNGSPSVRNFFNERRRMEATGVPVPPIDNHFRQAKGYSSPGGWSSRTGSGNSAKKFSAGRDRSQPLAPIKRPGDASTVDQARTAQTKTTYANGHQPPRDNSSITNGNTNPFRARPQLVKHKPLPPATNCVDTNNNEDVKSRPPKYGYQARMQQQQQQQQQRQQQRIPHNARQPQPQPPPPVAAHQQKRGDGRRAGGGIGDGKMTDFQKWQLEQNKAREERLKKLNSRNSGYEEEEEGEENQWGNTDSALSNRSRRSKAPAVDDSEDEDGANYDNEDEVARLERELLERISLEQAELKRLQKERERQEQEELADRKERQKRETADRARQKKLEEAQRKEEERRRKEEEEEMKRERARDEKRRKEEEKQNRDLEKRQREEEKQELKRRQEEEKRRAKMQNQQQAKPSSSRQDYDMRSPQSNDYDQTPLPSARRSPALRATPRQNFTMDEIDETPVAQSDSSYYAQMAKSSDAKGATGSLAKCRVCGRSFAQDRIKKHQDACKNVAKPRKVFDATRHRLEGTEAAKYAGKTKRPEPKKKNNWRSKHEEFIQSLRYAKKAAQIEKDGGDLRDLTPPPPTHNPDLVPCPNCGRTFNITAAERHIPRCKDLKTRPPPMKTRRR